MTNIYIFNFGNRIKIGKADDVDCRLKKIERMAGERAENVFSIKASVSCENKMYRELKHYRTVGEYFAYPYSDAVKLLKKTVSTHVEKYKSDIGTKLPVSIMSWGWDGPEIIKELNKSRIEHEKLDYRKLERKYRACTIRYSEVEEILDIMGYEIEWKPKPGVERRPTRMEALKIKRSIIK